MEDEDSFGQGTGEARDSLSSLPRKIAIQVRVVRPEPGRSQDFFHDFPASELMFLRNLNVTFFYSEILHLRGCSFMNYCENETHSNK